MALNIVSKTGLVDDEILFDANDPFLPDQLSIELIKNVIEIVSLDGSGKPIIPTGGTYQVTARTVEEGSFRGLSDNGLVLASETGGSASADQTTSSSSFSGIAHAIKVSPSAIEGATSYKVTITQSTI